MKKVLVSFAIVGFLASCGSNNEAVEAHEVNADSNEQSISESATEFKIDAAKSVVKWEGKKLAYGHHGVIAIKEGVVKVEGQDVVGASVSIDMSTIEETDNEDAEKAAQLAGHLKNADFFNVDSFPTAEVLVTKVEAGKVYAELTIKGITKGIEFPATINVSADAVSVKANFTINRTDWGIVYGSGSFMDLAKDKAIDDLISFDIDVVAVK